MYSEIAANKRRSVIVVVMFFVIWLAIGAALGFLFKAVAHPAVNPGIENAPQTNYGWGPVIIGIAIGGVLAVGGIVYSLNAGAGLVLRVSGAVPADPAQFQQLHNLVEALAIGEGIPKPTVYVIDDPSPNAFATGVSPEKAAITFTTGLLAIMNREELEGVASHEMSHIKNHDIRLLLVVGTMIGMAALLASILWRSAFFAGGGRGGRGNQIVIVIFAAGLLLAIVGFILGPLMRLALTPPRVAGRCERCGADPQPGGAAERPEEAAAERQAVQEHEPCHRGDVHRRPAAAPRGLVPPPLRHPPSHRGADRCT